MTKTCFAALPALTLAALLASVAIPTHAQTAVPDALLAEMDIVEEDTLLAQAAPTGAPARTVNLRDMCKERVARSTGRRAYLKARLDLKPEQMTAWSAFEKAAEEATAKQSARCGTLSAEVALPMPFADRLNMREAAMKARLEATQAVKPSLLALYGALNAEQKAVLDRPMGGGAQMGGQRMGPPMGGAPHQQGGQRQ